MMVSDINIHKEQLGEKAFYFNPDNPQQLADLIKAHEEGGIEPKQIFDNYSERIKIFARQFVQIYAD